jgi:hypothetical protein
LSGSIAIAVRLVHPEKGLPRFVTPFGIVIFAKLVHELNAELPMLITLSGIAT